MDDLARTLESLTADDRGTPTADILADLDRQREAGYDVKILTLLGHRVYLVTDPESVEHPQLSVESMMSRQSKYPQ